MFLKLKKGKQKEIICRAITKAGSERKLCKTLNLSKGALYRYKSELGNIPRNRLQKILTFLDEDIKKYEKYILEDLPKNWGRIKGGINCINKKKKEGTFQETVERLRKVSSSRMKQWHKQMKEKYPKKYHIWQYERFKKVGRGYTYMLMNKVPVRNVLEKLVGDFLILSNIKFEYEPYINIKGKAYFPDFKIKNKIIEVTEWKHPDKDKISKLKKKIKDYKENHFDVILYIPESVRKFYKSVDGSIVSTLPELKKSFMPS